MPSRQLFRHLLHEVGELDPCRIKMDLSFWRYFPGSTVVLEEPSGAGYMPGGVWPCGLVAGAPPLPVVIGPVQSCGCFSPFTSGTTVRPVLHSDLSVSPVRYPGLTGSLLRSLSRWNIELMPKKQVLNFKPAPRPEQIGDKRCKQMKNRKHHVE